MFSIIKEFKYLFLTELLLLSSFLVFNYPVIFVLLGLLLLFPAFYYSFEKPVFFLHLFLFSILAGSVGKISIGGKIPQVLFVDMIFPFFFAIFLLKVLFNSEENKSWNFISALLSFFVIWGLLSFIIAVDKLRTLYIWKSYLYGLFVFLFSYKFIKTPTDIKNTITALVLFGITLALIEIKIVVEMGGLATGLVGLFLRKNLLATSWGKSNYLATFYVLIIPITIGYYLVTKSVRKKIFIAVSILFMFTALILTLSRGGILALGIGIVFLLARILKPKTFLPILITIVLVAGILLINPLTYVLIERLSTVEQSFSYFTRVNFYKDVWQMFLDNPLTGVGIGNLGYHSKFIVATHSSAHNIVLGLLGETGIPGAIMFLTLLTYVVIKFYRIYTFEKSESSKILSWSFLSSIIGVYIHSMMEPNLEAFQFSIVFWCSVALFLRFNDLSPAEKKSVYASIEKRDA